MCWCWWVLRGWLRECVVAIAVLVPVLIINSFIIVISVVSVSPPVLPVLYLFFDFFGFHFFLYPIHAPLLFLSYIPSILHFPPYYLSLFHYFPLFIDVFVCHVFTVYTIHPPLCQSSFLPSVLYFLLFTSLPTYSSVDWCVCLSCILLQSLLYLLICTSILITCLPQ